MVGQGGETRSTLGNADPNTLLTSGTTISGTLGGTVNFTNVNVITGLTVSGGVNLQNVTGFFWRGNIFSGRAGGIGGGTISGTYIHLEDGWIHLDLSGQKVWVPYWISA